MDPKGKIELADGRIAPYYQFGDGPLSCFVFGPPQVYLKLLPEPLLSRFTFYCIDLYWSNSLYCKEAYPHGYSAITMDTIVNDVEDARQKLCPDKKIAVLGHSALGLICPVYAQKYPECASMVIMLNTPPATDNHLFAEKQEEYFDLNATEARKEQHKIDKFISEIKYQVPGTKAITITQDVRAKNTMFWYNPSQYSGKADWHGANVNWDFQEYFFGKVLTQYPTPVIAQVISDLRVPIWLGLGLYDYVVPVQAWLDILSDKESIYQLPANSEYCIFEESAHYSFVEDQDKFVKKLLEWVEESHKMQRFLLGKRASSRTMMRS